MTDTYRVYTGSKDKVGSILEEYRKRYSTPPQVLHINKVDTESTYPDSLEVKVESWVLPHHFFLEVLEADNEAQIHLEV